MSTRDKLRPIRSNAYGSQGQSEALDVPRCRVVQQTAQSIANSSTTATISYTAILWDTDGLFAAASPTRLTIRTQGTYDVKQFVYFTPNAVGNSRQSWVAVNGGTARYAYDLRAPSAVLGRVGESDTIALNAGDYLEVIAFQDSGGALVLAPAAGVNNGAELNVCLSSTIN